MRNVLITALVVIAILACGCSGGSKRATESVQADTTAVEVDVAVVPTAEPEIVLPDTAYASVRGLNFAIDVADSSINPSLGTTADLYADTPGSFTFRKGSRRDADFGGRLEGTPSDIVVDWEFRTSLSPSWGGGSGWTGQPLYVEWPDTCVERFRRAGVVNENFGSREVIVGSLSGEVYFINYDTGLATREPVNEGNPIKGTLSLDPTLNGNLYVGQGIPDTQPFGAFAFNLYTHRTFHFQDVDPRAGRRWGAYDSSAVRVGRFLFRPGENGTLYKYLVEPGKLTLQASLRYRINGRAPGMEASMGVYANYGFIADNAGTVLCINLETLRPVWRYDVGDDVDHSMVVELEDGKPYVYTGCEIDRQGEGTARLVKLDALTGSEIWRLEVPGRRAEVGEKHFDGGFYATSLPGSGDCADLLFASCVLNTKGQNGELMAIRRADGSVAYTTPLKHYGWSSPVGFLDPQGHQYVFAADCAGNAYIIRGATGEVVVSKRIGNNFESSPVVVGNTLVVGTRGDIIFRLSVK